MTDLTQALAAIHAATGGDLYDTEYEGGTWMVEATQTAETLADFETAAEGYAQCGKVERGTLAGFPFVRFGTVQVARGSPRRLLSVLDLGDVRVAVADDLTSYV